MLVNIMFANIIRKTEDEKFRNAGDWIFVFGRRKTGKTFYLKNFTEWDEYFFVTREGSVIRDDEVLTFAEFFPLFKSLLEGGKAIIVDEFHRLPPIFLDYLHSSSRKGKLRVVSSTLWLSHQLMEKRSPILGLFYAIPFSIIDERDILNSIRIGNKKERIETAVYLREPILIPFYKPPVRKFLARYLVDNKMTLQGLVGEIFREEEKYLSNVYDGIMHAVASGKNTSSEISSFLFSRGLLSKDNPGLIQGYLNTLVSMGIFQKEKVWEKKKFVYHHLSPLLDLFFYADEKYGLMETELAPGFIRRVIDEKLPFHVERFVCSLASKVYGMEAVKIDEPEIDLALVSFKKLRVVGEIKWGKVSADDVRTVEKKLDGFDVEEKILVVPDKTGLHSKTLRIMEPADLLSSHQHFR